MNLAISHQFEQGLFESAKDSLKDYPTAQQDKDQEARDYYNMITPLLQGEINRLVVDGKVNYTKLGKALNNKGLVTRFNKPFTYSTARMVSLKLKEEGRLTW